MENLSLKTNKRLRQTRDRLPTGHSQSMHTINYNLAEKSRNFFRLRSAIL